MRGFINCICTLNVLAPCYKHKVDLLLYDIKNRVGLLLHLQLNGQNLLLVNIHLTFPHNAYDRRSRLTQMKQFLHLIEAYQTKKNLLKQWSVIICEDVNGASDNDPVYQLLDTKIFSIILFCCSWEHIEMNK